MVWLFAIVSVVTWLAALRVATAWVGLGWPRLVTAAALFGAFATSVPVACGLAGLGTRPVVLAAVSLGGAGAGAAAGGRPVRRASGESAALALAALVIAHMAAVLAESGVTTDGFHLAEVVRWLHEGRPGTVERVVHEWPGGAYPLVNELILTWGAGLARSFGVAGAWTVAMTALLAGAGYCGLREAGARPSMAAGGAATILLAVAALVPLDAVGTDLPALAWLAAAAALAVTSRDRPGLLGPSLLALGLAIGTKTNVAPAGLAIVGPVAWRLRGQLANRATLAAAAAGLVAAGAWPARNLLLHGSPLWPFADLGFGDPVPYLLSEFQSPFLAAPLEVARWQLDHNRADFLRLLAALVAAAVSVAAGRSDRERRAAAVAAVALAAWAVSPLSGMLRIEGQVLGSVLYYVLPALVMAVAAIAVSTARVAPWLLGALAFAMVLELPPEEFADAHAVSLTAVAGAGLCAVLLRGRRLRIDPRVAAVAATGLLFAFITPATGRFMEEVTPAARWIADQPGDRPVVTNASPDGRWSGPRLERQVELMPLRTGCEAVRLRRRDAWLLVMRGRAVPRFYRSSFGEDCLRGETPAFADGAFLVYAPGPAR